MDTNDGRGEMRRVGWDFVPEAVVVGNGEFPVSALPLRTGHSSFYGML